MRRVIEVFSGACVVYLAMAACSGGAEPALFSEMRGSPVDEPTNQGGTVGMSSGQGGATGLPVATSGQPAAPVNSGGMLGSVMNPVPEAKAETSGSRLKAQYLVGEDGSRQFSNWLDTQLQTSCTFQKDAAGTMRCFPSSTAPHLGWFMDAECTQPVFLSPPCPSEYGLVWAAGIGSCSGGMAAYRLKPAPASAPDKVWRRNASGTCSEEPPTSLAGHYIGELVPNSTFAAAQLVTE